jgi:hypothetical protein
MMNRSVIGCQVELKIEEGGPGSRGQAQKRRESDRPLPNKDKADISDLF